ncbi:MAG: tRNA(Ile)-lysidine synthase [Actinomycetota bacterium]|jgi:tRNA(Ile)-lysidine synthase|nr:tRNA(Ile)-lysidine synthase [Actinomycetota bacterium]
MVAEEDTVVVGVSGGPDSTCLLDVLRRLPLGLKLVVAHVDHGLSEGSDKIAARVAAEASTAGLDVHLARAPELAGPNLQARARDFRYEFFGIVATQVRASKVATGHTLDDLVETIVARLIHGGGTEVLAGMRPVAGDRIRPLVGIRRDETRAYCEAAQLAFNDDPANEDERFERAFVRHKLIPVIEKRFGEGAIRAIAESGGRLREDADALGFLADRLFKEIAREHDTGVALDRDAMLAMPRALRRRMLERAVGEVRDRSGGIEAALDELEGSYGSPPGAKRFAVASGIEIAIDPQQLLVSRMPP